MQTIEIPQTVSFTKDNGNPGIQMTDTGSFTGYAARFLNIDRQGDIIAPGAFSKAINEFMNAGGMVLADHQNKTSSVVGTLRSAQEDSRGLLVNVGFSATQTGQQIRQLMREKALNYMSIGFIARPGVKISEKQVNELWQKYGYQPSAEQKQLAKSGANLIKDVAEIFEVSVVPIPANKDAAIISVKGANHSTSVEHPKPDLLALFERARACDALLLNR